MMKGFNSKIDKKIPMEGKKQCWKRRKTCWKRRQKHVPSAYLCFMYDTILHLQLGSLSERESEKKPVENSLKAYYKEFRKVMGLGFMGKSFKLQIILNSSRPARVVQW